jgi:glycosyltransferase EpsD
VKKKILFCASTLSHIKNFHLPYLEAFEKNGWEVWVAADKAQSVPFAAHVIALPMEKKLFSSKNLAAAFSLRRLLARENFSAVSAHTTLAGAVARLAVLSLFRRTKRRPYVFFTSHGYLFSGRGLRDRLYLFVEKLLAPITDTLMVMNCEDYAIAQTHHLYHERLVHINGMGLDLARFSPLDENARAEGRKRLGFDENAFLFVYPAEFSMRKNHALLIRAFAAAKIPGAHLLLAGDGALLRMCKALAKSENARDIVHFLGFVEDMPALYALCDAAVSTSRREGLPFNILEAMAAGLPVAASAVKGHTDLIHNEKTGLLFAPGSREDLSLCLRRLALDPALRKRLSHAAKEAVAPYALELVRGFIMRVYGAVCAPPDAADEKRQVSR